MRVALTCLLVASITLSVGRARADGEKGLAALALARKAFAGKEYAKARDLAVTAMEGLSKEPLLREAVLIRGKAHLGLGEKKKGLAYLRELLLLLEANVPLDDAGRQLWTRGRKALEAASPDDTALHRKMAKQAAKLAGISRKLVKKDPKAAERAALSALALDPVGKKGIEALKAARTALGAAPQELLDFPALASWSGLTDKNWPRKDGVLTGHVEKTAMMLNTRKSWSGNFDVYMEARLVKLYGNNGPPLFSLVAPFASKSRYLSFGYMSGNIELYEWTALRDGVTHGRKSYKDLPKKPDPKDWNKYELRVRADEVIALVNGVEVARQTRSADFKEGQIALKVQFLEVEIRSVTVVGR